MAYRHRKYQRSRSMRQRKGEHGFTLVETLVGLAILSAVLIATYSGVSNALRTANRVAERQAAVNRVQQEVDQLRRQHTMRAQLLQGETDSYRWRISVKAVQGPNGRSVVPFRIVGHLFSKSVEGRLVTIVDTIVLAGRR